MRILTVAMFVVAAIAVGPAMAQQSMPNQNPHNEADKGVKTAKLRCLRVCRGSRETGRSRPSARPA